MLWDKCCYYLWWEALRAYGVGLWLMTAKNKMAHETTTGTVIVFFNEDLHFMWELISHSVDCVYSVLSTAAATIHHAVITMLPVCGWSLVVSPWLPALILHRKMNFPLTVSPEPKLKWTLWSLFIYNMSLKRWLYTKRGCGHCGITQFFVKSSF